MRTRSGTVVRQCHRLTPKEVLRHPSHYPGKRGIRGSGLVHLAKLSELINLSLPGSVNDESLRHVQGLPELQTLGLHDAFTDNAIPHLVLKQARVG